MRPRELVEAGRTKAERVVNRANEQRSLLLSGALLLYLAVYLLSALSGIGFQSQFALANYDSAPSQPTSGLPQNESVVTLQDVPVNITVNDPDTQELNVTFWNADTDRSFGTDTFVPSGTRAETVWNNRPSGRYRWVAHSCESNGGNATDPYQCSSNSSLYVFLVNRRPFEPTDPSPPDGDTEASSDVDLGAQYDDRDDDLGTIEFYNASSDNLIGSCSVSDGNRCSITWSGLDDGDHSWYAVAVDNNNTRNQSDTFTFTVDTTFAPIEDDTRIQAPTETINLRLGQERVVPIRLVNQESVPDTYEITVATSPQNVVDADLIGGGQRNETVRVEMEPESTRFIRVAYKATSCVADSCSATVTFKGRSLQTDTRFIANSDVVVTRSPNVHGAPGITLLQVIVLALLGTVVVGISRRM